MQTYFQAERFHLCAAELAKKCTLRAAAFGGNLLGKQLWDLINFKNPRATTTFIFNLVPLSGVIPTQSSHFCEERKVFGTT
jgi:hypothetical protein